jgi:hypothetical protein
VDLIGHAAVHYKERSAGSDNLKCSTSLLHRRSDCTGQSRVEEDYLHRDTASSTIELSEFSLGRGYILCEVSGGPGLIIRLGWVVRRVGFTRPNDA